MLLLRKPKMSSSRRSRRLPRLKLQLLLNLIIRPTQHSLKRLLKQRKSI